MSDDAGLVRDPGCFDLEADVVVVGSGGCGLTAAIAAAQGGGEVLVLEKQARPRSAPTQCDDATSHAGSLAGVTRGD